MAATNEDITNSISYLAFTGNFGIVSTMNLTSTLDFLKTLKIERTKLA
jgi:hypothetical protein